MSLRIGICDDDVVWQEKVTETLRTYSKQEILEISISCFSDANSLEMYDGKALHILFMGIELKGINGIDLAMNVNARWPDCQIVYMTKQISHAMDVYRTQHIYFVLKDCFEEYFEKIMDKAKLNLRVRKQKIIMYIHGRKKLIFTPDEILYFEREKRITRIVSKKGEFVTNEKMDSLIERIPLSDFVRCHNSYIVNFSAIDKYEKNMFYIIDGKKISLSRSYREQAKRAFDCWIKKQLS